MSDEALGSTSQIEQFEIETKQEEKAVSKVKTYMIIGIVSLLVVLTIIIIAVPSKKKENDTPVTPKTEEELYKEGIKNKTRSAYTEKPISDSSTFILVKGTYVQMNASFLEVINKIRKEACDEGILDPRTNQSLTSTDYIPLQWSTDLEKISRIRASESTVIYDQTVRPNGGDIFGIKINNIVPSGDIIGNVMNNTPEAIVDALNKEKNYYKKDPSSTKANEYKKIINMSNRFMGMSYFYSDTCLGTYSISIELSNLTSITENKYLDAEENLYQTVDFLKSKIGDYIIETPEKIIEGTTYNLLPKISVSSLYSILKKSYAFPYNFQNYIFSTNSTDIISLSSIGKLEAKKQGTAIVTLTNEEKTIVATSTIKVECNHQFVFSYTKDSEQKTVGHKTCSLCGYKIDFHPPNDVTVLFCNNVTTGTEYSSDVPTSNPIGSALLIMFMIDSDADDDYEDMLVKVSDNGYLEEVPLKDNKFKFIVLKNGNVSLTFYPKYNENYTQVFNVPLGN